MASIVGEDKAQYNSLFLCGDRQESSDYVATLLENFRSIILLSQSEWYLL